MDNSTQNKVASDLISMISEEGDKATYVLMDLLEAGALQDLISCEEGAQKTDYLALLMVDGDRYLAEYNGAWAAVYLEENWTPEQTAEVERMEAAKAEFDATYTAGHARGE